MESLSRYESSDARVEVRGGDHVACWCRGCGYEIADVPPLACPMCADTTWVAGCRSTGEITLTRLAGAAFLTAPLGEIDAATGVVLADTIATLAQERAEIVLDLTRVAHIDDHGGRLLLRLSALARGAGGRLLVVYSSATPSGFALDELDPDDPDAGKAVEGPLGRALRHLKRARQQ